MLVVQARKNRSSTIFGRSSPKSKLSFSDSGEESDSPQFDYYEPKFRKVMKLMGYNFTKGEGLCFNQGRRTSLQPCIPEGKNLDYCSETRRDLGYVSFEVEFDVLQECSSGSTPLAQSFSFSKYDSDVCGRHLNNCRLT